MNYSKFINKLLSIEIERNTSKFFILALLFLFLVKSSNRHIPYPTGDGPEYVLTTEAMFNHNSADLRLEDALSFKKESTIKKNWSEIPKYTFFDSVEDFLKHKDALNFLDSFYGSFYVDKEHKVYVHHFMFYSLVNVPMRYVMHWIGQEPLLGFEYTNIVLILLTCSLLLFYDKNSFWNSLAITLLFFFNAVFWYVNWIHTEAMTACFASASIFLLFQKRNYLAILLMSIAALQNQPLAILALMIVLYTIYLNNFSIKSFLLSGLASIIVLWPSIFYYAHYGITNLVSHGGYLTVTNITPERFIGFFYDLNQGALLALPIIMLAYPLLIVVFIIKSIKSKSIEFTLFIPIAILIITYIVCMMSNWVHGMAVINRYAVWISAIIALHFYYLFSKLDIPQRIKIYSISIIIVSQIFTTIYFEKDNVHDWMGNVHKAPAKWVLDHYPSLYNPDPNIFIIRTTHNYLNVMEPEISPVIYINNDIEIMKLAVHRNKLDQLKEYGISDAKIADIASNNRFILDWTYLNKSNFENIAPSYSFKMKKQIQDSLINQKIAYIKTDSNWIQSIREKALKNNMSLDTMLLMDAKYDLNIR